MSSADVRRLVRQNKLRRAFRNVFVAAEVAESLEVRCRAVSLVAPDGIVICDRTAAWIHGVDALAYWELDGPLPLEAVVPPQHVRPRRSDLKAGERDLSPTDVQEIHGVWVTTMARSALDLACKLRRRHALATVDALMRIGGIGRVELQRELDRYRGRRGVIQARELIDIADPKAESPGESWVRLAIVDEGLPMPVSQVWVLEDDVAYYRLDLAYPKLRIAVEFDGIEVHSKEADREADERRRAWLRARGWHVIVVRNADLAPDRRGRWLAELRRVLAERQRNTFRYGRFDAPGR